MSKSKYICADINYETKININKNCFSKEDVKKLSLNLILLLGALIYFHFGIFIMSDFAEAIVVRRIQFGIVLLFFAIFRLLYINKYEKINGFP